MKLGETLVAENMDKANIRNYSGREDQKRRHFCRVRAVSTRTHDPG